MERVNQSPAARDAVYRADTVLPSLHEVIGVQSSFSIHSEPDNTRNVVDEQHSAAQDKFAHTRGKRKRTSREDFQILECAYQRNARPDKTTRLAIVDRVSLSEKEVQIWFQNRRQMTRRKCRTWQPNEITSIIRLSQEQNTSSISDDPSRPEDEAQLASSFQTSFSEERCDDQCETLWRSEKDSNQPDDVQISSDSRSRLSGEDKALCSDAPSSEIKEGLSRPSESHARQDTSDASASPGPQETLEKPTASQGASDRFRDVSASDGRLKRKSSAIRLSLSFGGKAEVLLGSESPSPPKKPMLPATRVGRAGGIQRSQSAVSPTTQEYTSLGIDVPEWRRSRAPGRSRDARTWEFYCDSDARNALTKTAEHDQKGTAQAVLGLIRSSSNARKPLTPVRRENVPLQRTESTSSKKSAVSKLPRVKLSRSSSSLPRLQTTAGVSRQVAAPVTKSDKEIEIWQDNFGDSDKENQDPDDCHHRTSGFHTTEKYTSAKFYARAAGSTSDKENIIKGRSNHVAKHGREEEELDAVQNLLRLSQGDWR